MSARQQPYTLKHDIVLETRDPETKEEREEILRPAGSVVMVRRPKAKDLLVFDQFDGKPIASVTALIKRVVKLDDIEVANLDGEDFDALGELVSPPEKGGRTTGKTASD
ncbi:hypothetical protein [Novosphingobium naphthalenivorans]|uniref:hypothetical protein n=1 Tax=Novosphingobium naphthalenivorans TaxID=273168 RepID=UPI00082DBF2E|nr:hypothetical protein [Novosphingobium naphthalenivorans]